MNVNLTMDTRQLDQFVGLAPKRLAYACANAINATALRIQTDMRAGVQSRFTVRARASQFVLRQAAILKPRASVGQGRPYAEISVGQKPGLLLSQYEAGGERKPMVGRRAAVPVYGSAARPSFSQSVPTQFTFKGLGFIQKQSKAKVGRFVAGVAGGKKARRTKSVWGKADTAFRLHITAAGQKQWKGQRRTFILASTVKAPEGGVFQRMGPGRDDIRMIYSFVRDQHLAARLEFMRTAQAVGQTYFREEMERQIQDVWAHDLAKVVA
jgi:hypothetical protein